MENHAGNAMTESDLYCVLQSAVTGALVWQIFNLQFEAFRRVSKPLRLAASALLFALISSLCAVAAERHLLRVDWPELLTLMCISCLVQRLRRSGGVDARAPHRHP